MTNCASLNISWIIWHIPYLNEKMTTNRENKGFLLDGENDRMLALAFWSEKLDGRFLEAHAPINSRHMLLFQADNNH